MKIRPVRAELFHPDGQTDMTKLTVAFRSFAKEPKMDRAPWSVFVVSSFFFQFRFHVHDIFYRKLHISQKAFCQHHSQTHVTDSLNLTALYHRWRLMHILSQRNVKFQSIIRKVNTSCAELSWLSLDIGNVRLLLNRQTDTERERERESVCVCVFVCVRAPMCTRVHVCKPSVRNPITAEFQNSPSITGIINVCFLWEEAS